MFGNKSATSIEIKNNEATFAGGFISCYSNSMIEIHQYNFINNKAINIVEESKLSMFGIDNNTPKCNSKSYCNSKWWIY